MLRRVDTMTDSSWIIWLPPPSTGDCGMNFLLYTSNYFVYCVFTAENLFNHCNAATEELPIQGHFFPGVYQRQLSFGTLRGEMCAHSDSLVASWSPHYCFLYSSTAPRCFTHRSLYILNGRCSGGSAVDLHSQPTSPRPEMSSPLDGTCLFVLFTVKIKKIMSVPIFWRKHTNTGCCHNIIRNNFWLFRLTKQMLVSGMMSESETASSFPDRLPELPKASSAPKLKQRKSY